MKFCRIGQVTYASSADMYMALLSAVSATGSLSLPPLCAVHSLLIIVLMHRWVSPLILAGTQSIPGTTDSAVHPSHWPMVPAPFRFSSLRRYEIAIHLLYVNPWATLRCRI